MDPTRIATVGYLNAEPLTAHIDRDRFSVETDHPAAIAAKLDSGEVQVALVPVAAVLANPTLRILPGWCIGADGPVTSVLLVAERPMAEWTRLVLDGESRSSAALARLLLKGPLAAEVSPDLEVVAGPPGCGREVARGTTAALVIGDAAREVPDRLSVRIDLAERYTEWTGLPFVFAVWAARPGLDPEVIAHLRQAGAQGVSTLEAHYQGADLIYLRDALRYPLDDRALMGLRRFAALAARAGLLPQREVVLLGPDARSLPRAAHLETLLDQAAQGVRLSADEALQLFEGASLSDLGAAATERRFALHPEPTVGYLPLPADQDDEARLGLVEVVLDESGTSAQIIDDLARVRALQDASGGVLGVCCRVAGATASELLRLVAIARLFLDNVPHIETVAAGTDAAQAALWSGADDLGRVEGDDLALVAEVERSIRAAGFSPLRRGPTYETVGGPLTADSLHKRRIIPLPEHLRV